MARKFSVKNTFLLVVILLSLALTVFPTSSWVYQDGTPSDNKFERFGPRADRLRIDLFANDNAVFEQIANGTIDVAEPELDKEWYDLFTSNEINPYTGLPYNETINVISCGSSYYFFMLDINNNGNEYLGNPPDPSYPNPVYPNPCSVVSFRQALWHLVDRTILNTFLLPIYVPLPPSVWPYSTPNPYPYDPAAAEDLLEADGFPINPDTGWRYWDRNGNGQEDPDEYLELKFFIRSDHPTRKQFGDWYATQLELVKIRVNAVYGTISAAWVQVMNEKDYHLYTGAYYADSISFLYTFHSSNYWHPGFCPNHNGIMDPEYDYYVELMMSAPTLELAEYYASLAIEVFLNKSFKVPLWSWMLWKAMNRVYTGGNQWKPVTPDDGENAYRGIYWQGVVSQPGHCIDNFFTFLNMHPTDYEYGDCENMTIRYGVPFSNVQSLNPIYASSPPDWLVLNLIYDRMIRQNPYNTTEWMLWMVKNYTVGTYMHPIYGECTKISFTLRTDIYWSDGTPLTVADIHYTFVEMKHDLEAAGHPPPWWISNVENILSFSILDPYNFEILFDSLSIFFLESIGKQIILPKHVWKAIICGPDGIPGTGDDGDPTTFAPDPNLIGSGPWRLKEYVENSHVVLVANKRCQTIQTNLPGSEPIHSPFGYFRYYPLNENIHVTSQGYEYRHKFPLNFTADFTVSMENMIREHEIFENASSLDLSRPLGSWWHKAWPTPCLTIGLSVWIDDGDGQLSPGDIIALGPPLEWDYWYYITAMWVTPTEPVTWFIEVIRIIIAEKTLIIDGLSEEPEIIYLKPAIPHEQLRIGGFKAGLHFMELQGHMLEPDKDTWLLRCTWVNYTFPFWVTIKEDICGSTLYDDLGYPDYPYKQQLQSPDAKVDIFDVAKAARAFGSYPGHERWCAVCDINGDYNIDILDIASIAAKFGWVGDP